MQLVVRGLKMQLMSTNLQLTLKKTDLTENEQFIDAQQALAPYQFYAQQLGAEFVHRLAD